MEKLNIEQQKNVPETVEEAVKAFIDSHDTESAIDYLRKNHKDITEFCLQVFESYQERDKTGIMLLARIIEKTL